MGREADCVCRWGGEAVEVRALLETRDVILRGGIRRRLAVAEMMDIRVDGGDLAFCYRGEDVSLELGAEAAHKWESALKKPPPSLAHKLGITEATRVRVIGDVDDSQLEEALAVAAEKSPREGDVIVARIDTIAELDDALRRTEAQRGEGTPIWIVYPKGMGHALGEGVVRNAMRDCGMIDTKVAAVSSKLTALRFIVRKA